MASVAIRQKLLLLFAGIALCATPSGCFVGSMTVFLGYQQQIKSVALSPDGSTLAFTYANGENRSEYLYTYQLNGSGFQRVAMFNKQILDSRHYREDEDIDLNVPNKALASKADMCSFTDFQMPNPVSGSGASTINWDTSSADRIASSDNGRIDWAGDGNIYVLDPSYSLICVQPDGVKKWKIPPQFDFSLVCPNYKHTDRDGFTIGSFAVSPDSRLFAGTHGVLFDASGHIRDVLLKYSFPKGLASPTFSPNGKSLAFISYCAGPFGLINCLDESRKIVIVNLDDESSKEIAIPDGWQPLDVHWMNQGTIHFQASNRESTRLASIDTTGGNFQLVDVPWQWNWGDIAFSENLDRVYHVKVEETFKSSLYVTDLVTKETKVLLDSKELPRGQAVYAH